MKIKEITLRNYKRFVEEKTIFFHKDDEINDLTLIVGNNGTGKTSLLQAIVMMIAPLTRNNFSVEGIDWSGFEYRFIQSGGRIPLKIEATIHFSEEELNETILYAERLKELEKKLVIPNKNKEIKIFFDYENGKPFTKNPKDSYQLSGYQYAKQLTAFEADKSKLFEKVGNIYWYTEQRTSYSVNNMFEGETSQLDAIRSFLASAYSFHIALERGRELKAGEFDFYKKISELYSIVFTDRKFVGSTPRFDIYEKTTAPDFFLNDGKNDYELSEMSAGERAIFPILMDFARYNINNSIIIIDEIELHLHAPLQQAFIRALPKLGHNNQFILTSHSDYVTTMFEENQIIKLN